MIEHYPINKGNEEFTYEFESIGKKGIIRKIVRFVRVRELDYFQFGFGDLDEKTGKIDDIIVSNNGDTALILATLGKIIEQFTAQFPTSWIHAKGNTATRNRFYCLILSKNLALIEEKYQLFGLYKGVLKPYEPNKPYTAFLLKRKENE